MLIPKRLVGGADYQIPYSVMFDNASGTKLEQASGATPDDSNYWTFATWLKPLDFTGECWILEAQRTINQKGFIVRRQQSNGNQIGLFDDNGATTTKAHTPGHYVDTTAWVHMVIQWDGTQAAGSNCRMWINGVEKTLTHESMPTVSEINAGTAYALGWKYSTSTSTNHLLAETILVDGLLKTADDFGRFDGNGVWQPKKYGGSYGSAGFYLDYADSSDLGKDLSGNGNHFTSTNMGTDHQFVDTPTNNYAVMGESVSRGSPTLGEGGRTFDAGNNGAHMVAASLWLLEGDGKFYAEVELDGTEAYVGFGNDYALNAVSSYLGSTGSAYAIREANGDLYNNGSNTSHLTAPVAGDVINIAVDMDNMLLWFGLNGSWVGDPSAGTGGTSIGSPTSTNFFTFIGSYGGVQTWAFQEQQWQYSEPTGFKSLCAQNLPVPEIDKGTDHANVVLYDSAGPLSVTGMGFQPDMLWLDARDNSVDSPIVDSSRGSTAELIMNGIVAETTVAQGCTSFDADGFSVGTDTSYCDTTGDGMLAVGWAEGAIPGFEIVTYTGTGVARDIAHSLGVAPWALFIKNRDQTDSWAVYNKRQGNDSYLRLNSAALATTSSTVWDNTDPDADSFRVGTDDRVNAVGEDYVAYVFAPVAGFSRFAGYLGNGNNNGDFIPTGFEPLVVLIKCGTAAYNWALKDGVRNPDNPVDLSIWPNASGTLEDASYPVEFLSSGIKISTNTNPINRNGEGYRIWAWGIHPQQRGRAR